MNKPLTNTLLIGLLFCGRNSFAQEIPTALPGDAATANTPSLAPVAAAAAPSTTNPTPTPSLAPGVAAPVPVAPQVQVVQVLSVAERQLFADVNEAILRNEFARASAILRSVSASSTNQAALSSARVLRDLVKQLVASQAHFSFGAAPDAAPNAEVGVYVAADTEGGRANFVITTTLAAFYASFGLVDVLGIDQFTPFTLTVAASTAAGLLLSLRGTRDLPLRPATAAAYSSGLVAGLANALLAAPRLGIRSDGDYGDGEVNQNYLLFSIGTMAAGGATGYLLGRNYHPTQAQVTATTMAGYSGLISVGLGLVALDAVPANEDSMALMLALGMDAGMAGAALLTRDIDWSPARGNYVALSQFVGALGGFTLGALAIGTPDSDAGARGYAGLVTAGLWVGMAGGIYATRNMSPDSSLATKPSATSAQLMPLLGRDNLRGMALAGSF